MSLKCGQENFFDFDAITAQTKYSSQPHLALAKIKMVSRGERMGSRRYYDPQSFLSPEERLVLPIYVGRYEGFIWSYHRRTAAEAYFC
jgi:hypothetical protein